MNKRNRHQFLLGCACAALNLPAATAQDDAGGALVGTRPDVVLGVVLEQPPRVIASPTTPDLRRTPALERSPFDLVDEADLPPIEGEPSRHANIDAEIARHEVALGSEVAGPLLLDADMESIDIAEEMRVTYTEEDATTAEENAWVIVASPPDEPRFDVDDPVERFLFSRHVHGPNLDEGSRLADRAFDPAREVLRSAEHVDYHANALTLIALGGSPEAERVIVDYLVAPFTVEPSAGFSAKAAAIVALGVLARATDGEQGLEFLLETSDPDGWRAVGPAWEAPGIEDTPQELAILSVSALSLSGAPAARKVLTELVEGPDDELVRRGLERTDVLAFLEQHERDVR